MKQLITQILTDKASRSNTAASKAALSAAAYTPWRPV